MAFDPDEYLSKKEAPASPPPFDPDSYLKSKESPAPADAPPNGFDPDKYLGNKVDALRDDSAFDPAMHAAQTGDADTAFRVYQARKARTTGEKALELGKTLVTPETYVNAGKGVVNFLRGFGDIAKRGLVSEEIKFDDRGHPIINPDAGLTKRAEYTLTAQTGEEAGKHMLDATVGNAAASLMKMGDPDPARTAYREGYLKRNPAGLTKEQLEARKEQWAKEDAEERKLQAENIDRRVFDIRVQGAKNQLQLSEGKPLDTGIISKIYEAGNQVPSEEVGPEALKAAGVPQADLEAVTRMSAAVDPNNIALAMAPAMPGAKFIGGGATELAGKTISGTGSAISAVSSAVNPLTTLRRLVNPASLATDAAKEGGARGLRAIGDALAAQGKELRTGAPSTLTTKAATAAATGERAIGTNIARFAGDTTARGATTAAGMAPLNLALSEGDPKAFGELQVGAGTFGGALGAFSRNRASLVEGTRPFLRSEGARALAEAGEGNDALAARSAAYLFSLPEAARDTALEAIGALQGLPLAAKDGPKRAKVYVLSGEDYNRAQADVIPGQQAAMGGGRGFFYGPDGAAYINGDFHAGLGPEELSHTIGHEFGGHAATNIMRAAGDKGGALYKGLMDSAAKSLMPDGKPTPAFRRFVKGYNEAFDPTGKTKRLNPYDPESMEEFISEQAGQIFASRGAAELALPKNVQDRITEGLGRFMGDLLGFDTRKIGTETKFSREEIGELTQAVQDTLSQIVGMKLRDGAEMPEAPKTRDTRIAELQQVLATPRPADGTPVEATREWRAQQRQARTELAELLPDPVVQPRARRSRQSAASQPPTQTPNVTAPGPVSAPSPNESLPNRATVPASGDSSPATQTSTPAVTAVAEVAQPRPVAPEAPRKPVPSQAEVDALVADVVAKAEAAEKRPSTKKAQDAIRQKKVDAILDAIGEDATGLHRTTDEFGFSEITGDFDPSNPLHTALVDNLPSDQAAKVVELQSSKGTPVYVRYRSSLSSAEGEGGAGTMDTGMANRRAEYANDPAARRNQGTIQHKVIIPLETSVSKAGGVVVRAFVPDNILHNAESVFEGLKETGRPNPYGETPDAQGRLLMADAQAYAQNHQNGYRGDGSGPIRQFPDSNLPRPVEGYEPTVIPKERFDILNMVMHEERASKLADLEAKADAAQNGTGKELTRTQLRQLARAREAAGLALENSRWIDPMSGETNQLRKELKDAGFDTGERFKSPFENLLPQHLLDVSDAPIALQDGDIPSVRPTGMSVDPMEVVRRGRPNERAAAAGFLPDDSMTRQARSIPGMD